MKIAQFISSNTSSGAGSTVINIADGLTQRGIDNVVFHYENKWLSDQLNETSHVLPEMPLKQATKFGKVFGDILKEHNITHLHSHVFNAIIHGAFAAKHAGIPHTGTLHEVISDEERKERIRWLKIAVNIGTKLVTVSDHMNKSYRKAGRRQWFCTFPDDNPITIHNGINTSTFRPSALMNKDDTKLTLISVGQLDGTRNTLSLLKAVDQLNEDGISNIQVLIVGDGPELEYLHEFVRFNLLDDQIKFLGNRTDIPDLLNASDVFVRPSLVEGSSCGIVEAMACGLPAIASNTLENRDLIGNDVHGWLFDPDLPDALKNKIFLAHTMKDSLRRMGERNSNIIDTKFSIKKMMNQYIAVYQGK